MRTFFIFAIKKMVLEACVETFEQAVIAEKKGADRIELCSRLDLGGITPDSNLILKTSSFLNIPVVVMIRPRGGDFVYSQEEVKIMLDQIKMAKEAGAAGIVLGLLTRENQIDTENTRVLVKAAKPLPVTFHKAIDLLPDPADGVAILKHLGGIARILTSGGKTTAIEGNLKIAEMIETAGDEIHIIVAGKVTDGNLQGIIQLTGAEEFHGKEIVGILD